MDAFAKTLRLALICTLLAATAACSNDTSGGTNVPATYGDAVGDADNDATLGDGSASDGSVSDAGDDATLQDSGSEDSGSEDAEIADATGADSAGADASVADTGFPDGFFDPPDESSDSTVADTDNADVPVGGPVGELYAHTGTELYRLDLEKSKLTFVGNFTFDKNGGDVNDIAIDRFGTLYAVGIAAAYICDRETAACKYLAKLPVSYNGLTFVPDGVVDPVEEALIGMGADGSWNWIKLVAGKATINKLGEFGGSWVTSGDGFSVYGIGTFATIKGKGNGDSLAEIDPKTGKLLKIIGETGVTGLFGFAWWSGKFYAFSKAGDLYTLDVNTGKATKATNISMPKGKAWYGAGVSTRAAGG